MIGVIGKSGDGKSTLLNAVLKEDHLLPGHGYLACTAVPIQICSSEETSNRGGKYKAEVEFVSKQEWLTELKCLLDDAKSEDLADDDDGEDDKMMRDIRNVALAKCKAVYGDLDLKSKSLDQLSAIENDVTKLLDSMDRETGNISIFAADSVRCCIYEIHTSLASWLTVFLLCMLESRLGFGLEALRILCLSPEGRKVPSP